jgi:hypothetical protein
MRLLGRPLQKKAVETKRGNTLQRAASIPIQPLAIFAKSELISKAVSHYNSRQSDFALSRREIDYRIASVGDDEYFLNRLCVNYLRHCCSNYDSVLARFLGRVGTGEAYTIVKRRVLLMIGEVYTWLAEECEIQSNSIGYRQSDFIIKTDSKC